MRTKHGIFPHNYEKLISKETFQQAQAILNGYHTKPFQAISIPFALRGLVSCEHCGCIASPEIKKGKYVYYSCTNAKGNCRRVYVREEVLLDQLTPYFDRIALSEEQIQKITEYLKQIHQTEQLFMKEEQEALRKEMDKVQNRISRMYDDKLDGLIDEKLYQQKLKEFKARQQEIVSKMERHVKADESFHITANKVMNLAKSARQLFESSEVEEKRQLLNLVFQNLRLEGKKLLLTLREPFSLIMQSKECPEGWGRLDSNQRRPKSRDLQSLTHPQPGVNCNT